MEAPVIAAIITSIVSGGLTIIKMYMDFRDKKRDRCSQEKSLENTQKAEDTRTKMQIDANIVWSARVEWIQNVRNITAELITVVNNYILSRDEDTQKELLEIIRKNSELLILYFGPDEKSSIEIDILNKTTNESKNEKIVELIRKIRDEASVYFLKENWKNEYHNNVSICEKCKESSEVYSTCEIIADESISPEEMEKRCKNHMEFNLEMASKYLRENSELRNDITELTEAMRIYLKLEWKRAKERTDV